MTSTAAELGDDLADLVISEINKETNDISRQIIYSRVMRALAAHELYQPPKPTIKTPRPMLEAEVRQFRRKLMPFGIHVGQEILQTPITYLCGLCDPSPFLEDLKRYLLSEEGRRRIETGD